jgi:predicted DNA-binding WGR domain protein
MIVNETRLWFYGGGSDKVYIAQIVSINGTYEVRGQWGRRGKTLQSQTKGVYHSHWSAMIAYKDLVASKTGKGYEVTGHTVAAN